MSETLKAAVHAAILRMLGPLVRLLLELTQLVHLPISPASTL